jgi:flagellar basal-body rod protein FlgG
MITALWSGATGMSSQQILIDAISNNLSNVNTTGFKKQRVQFQDLYYETLEMGEGTTASVGHGSMVSATQRSFRQGNLEPTDEPLFAAIEGQGFFQIETPRGLAYTRDGSFRLDAEGRLVTSQGYRVIGYRGRDIRIPEGATELSITSEGVISGRDGSNIREFGEIALAMFQNPAGLEAIGGNLFLETEVSGEPRVVIPTQDGSGAIRGGYLETSNVDLVSEMVNLIVAQRAFEMNSKTVQTADQMWALANNLKA